MALSDTFTTLGNTIINLVNSRTAHKQNQLIAGDGIQITENTEEKNADICIHPDIEAAFQSVIDELNDASTPDLPVLLLEDIADGSAALPEKPFIVSTNMTEIPTIIPEELSGVEDLPYVELQANTHVVQADFSNVKYVNSYGLYSLFSTIEQTEGAVNITSIDLGSLQSVGYYGLANLASRCTELQSVNINNVVNIGKQGLSTAFMYCAKLTSINLSNVTNIDEYGMFGAFINCISLTSLSFPALKSDSFGSYTNQFNSMLQGVTACTVHFPSNLESVIGSWSDVTNGFGGTNTTVLFDLPATT